MRDRQGRDRWRRGITVVGVDVDRSMLEHAGRAAPDIEWIEHDLATLDVGRTFDVKYAHSTCGSH